MRCPQCATPRHLEHGAANATIPYNPKENLEPKTLRQLPGTLAHLALRPSRFFLHLDPQRYAHFALLFGFICAFTGALLALLLLPTAPEAQASLLELQRQYSIPPQALTLLIILALPFTTAAEILFYGLLLHLSIRILHPQHRGLLLSFKIVAYAMAARLLLLIPVAGTFVAMVAFVVLLSIGVRLAQGLSVMRAVIAISIPILFLSGLGIFALT